MKKVLFFLVGLCLIGTSCTKDKTDYEAELDDSVSEHVDYKEAAKTEIGAYQISIEARNGVFYKGYNEIRLRITDTSSGEAVDVSSVTFLPIMISAENEPTSCPHRYEMVYQPDSNYFSGYSVFTNQSTDHSSWALYLGIQIGSQNLSTTLEVPVEEQVNKNLSMTAFEGNDGEQYFISLIAPQKPEVAENDLIAGVYKYNKPSASPSGKFPDPSQFSYSIVNDYTLALDPRMPEPSMGNHSSPNNKDLTQQDDGLYHGVVNYTMTGNWTLNLIMMNDKGRILKGTKVPADFTPGVEGVKSELHIDILF